MKTLSNNFFIIKLAWGASPIRVISEIITNFIRYFLWVVNSIVFLRYILAQIQKKSNFNSIVLFILLIISLFGISALFEAVYKYRIVPITNSILSTRLNKKLFEKATEVELACYEDTEFYNNYTLSVKEADRRITAVLSNIFNIFFAVFAAIVVVISMFSIDKIVIVFVICPLVGNFFFGKLLNKAFYERELEMVPFRRRQDYVSRVLYLQDYAKEVRLSNIFKVLTGIYENGYNGVIQIINKYKRKIFALQVSSQVAMFPVIFQGVMLYSAYRTLISKTMDLSEFAVLTGAMTTITWILIGLSDSIMKSFENSLYIEKLRNFLDYKPEIPESQDGILPEKYIKSIEFRNVSFCYKGQSEPVIDNLSFKISANEKIAIVGYNGSGKTTLVKLLMRLYDPTSGQIFVNGIDIREYNLKAYRKLYGTAFQDYKIFSMSVAENILMNEIQPESDHKVVIESLKKSGVYEKVNSFSNKHNTTLTKEFDLYGEMLSGGEAQKIAVARAFAKDFSIGVFDEPSSALDPIAESKLFESIMEVCENKMAVFISHRLSSAVSAHRIYLMEKGKVIESGTHKELIDMRGIYAEMFKKQAEKYVEENFSLLEEVI